MNDIGARLQAARKRADLSLVQAAERLHVDPNVIHALETEQFDELGGAVYVRGHLRHYAELVAESAPELLGLYANAALTRPPPDLTLMPHVKQGSPLRGALVVAGVAVVIGVGLVGSIHWIYLDLHPVAAAAAAIAIASAPAAEPGATTARPVPSAPKAVAPPARPAKAAHAAIATTGVTLRFKSACWTEVYDARGGRLYHAIGAAGEVAELHGAAPLKVVVGNPAVVDIEINGRAQGIPAQVDTGRKAEFLVTLAGELQPMQSQTTADNKPRAGELL